MVYLLEMSVAGIFLVCAASVTLLFLWRMRALEKRMSVLLHAALTNTREIRQCIGRVEDGFGGLRKADGHRRVMLASLSGQIAELNRMLAHPVGEPPLTPPLAANAGAPAAMQADAGAGSAAAVASPLPGYRLVPRRYAEQAAGEGNDAEAARQRKIRRIEALFARVGQPAAEADASADQGSGAEAAARVATFPAVPRRPDARAAVGLAEVFSQRRSVVNG
ncbi:MAG: hypothetical protein BroJett030_01560 [Alphaproteobacteria bacterium]|nr:MAG: hypothetical protein BroJett030_01560 [Alphaproteobacteria bacterium]